MCSSHRQFPVFFPLTRAKRCHSPWMGRLNTSEHEQTRDPPTSKQATSPVANCHDGAHSGLRASSNTPDSAVPIEINATLETAGTSGRKMANASPKYRETKFVHGGPSMVELAQDGPNDTAFLLPPWAVHTHSLSLMNYDYDDEEEEVRRVGGGSYRFRRSRAWSPESPRLPNPTARPRFGSSYYKSAGSPALWPLNARPPARRFRSHFSPPE